MIRFKKYVETRDTHEAAKYFVPGLEELEPRILPSQGVVPVAQPKHLPPHIVANQDVYGAKQITMPQHVTTPPGHNLAGFQHSLGMGIDPKHVAAMMQAQHTEPHHDEENGVEGVQELAKKAQEELSRREGGDIEIHGDEHGDLHVELPELEDAHEMRERLEKAKEETREVLERLGRLVTRFENTGSNSFVVFLQPTMSAKDAVFASLNRAESVKYKKKRLL